MGKLARIGSVHRGTCCNFIGHKSSSTQAEIMQSRGVTSGSFLDAPMYSIPLVLPGQECVQFFNSLDYMSNADPVNIPSLKQNQSA